MSIWESVSKFWIHPDAKKSKPWHCHWASRQVCYPLHYRSSVQPLHTLNHSKMKQWHQFFFSSYFFPRMYIYFKSHLINTVWLPEPNWFERGWATNRDETHKPRSSCPQFVYRLLKSQDQGSVFTLTKTLEHFLAVKSTHKLEPQGTPWYRMESHGTLWDPSLDHVPWISMSLCTSNHTLLFSEHRGEDTSATQSPLKWYFDTEPEENYLH